jgi:geranylgeranylglyceryl phosphate synthase family protein
MGITLLDVLPVERLFYKLRESHPLVVPQLDPSSIPQDTMKTLLVGIKKAGVKIIAIGGSITDSKSIQNVVDSACDLGLFCVLYADTSTFNIRGKSGQTAIYWTNIMNAENTYFSRDMLIQNVLSLENSNLEPIPTAYVFDDRGCNSAARWVSRSNPIPRDKPYISLCVALSAQFSGLRFYIMAGGSGCKLLPPIDHIQLLRKKTTLFLMPTSGIRTSTDAAKMFEAGADAIHVGSILEEKNGLDILNSIIDISNKFPGRRVI